eukprot:jgi/Galph1/3757/GphlegSOOS_G2423.1
MESPLEVAKFISSWLKQRNWNVTLQSVAPRQGTNTPRLNILATRREDRNPPIILCSHFDTVPPFIPSYYDNDGYLYGRGVCDALGLVASMLVAAQEFSQDVGLLFVAGEETDHGGMMEANRLGLETEYLIVGEPTENKMPIAQAGVLKMKVMARGKSSHSAYPERGQSAINPLIELLAELVHWKGWPVDSELGETSMNIGLINGGIAANVIPDNASAEIMFRVVSDPLSVEQIVKQLAKKHSVLVETYSKNGPVRLFTLNGYDNFVAKYNTDIPYARFYRKALLFGAGSILDAHTAEEKIAVEDLRNLPQEYKKIVTTLLQSYKNERAKLEEY